MPPRAQPDTDGVHRLRDIQVEEVSLVDRPANKRRFSLVKRDTTMQLVSNGRGGFTRVSKNDDEEAEKAKKPFPGAAKPFGGDGDDEEEKAKKKAKDEEEEKAKKAKDDDGEEKSKAKKVDASGAKLAEELEGHIENLQALVEQLEDMEDEEPSDVHMKKLDAAHKKLGGMCEKYMSKTSKRQVEKIGRKMAAARLSEFEKAIGTLQALLSELMDTPAKAKEHEADPGDPSASPKGWSPANPSDVPSGASGTAGGWRGGKNADNERLEKALAKLEEQGAEIARLKRRVPNGNSMSVEKAAARRESNDVSWPLDMNRPIERGTVQKSESFFDDD